MSGTRLQTKTTRQKFITPLLLLISLAGVFPLDVILPSFPALSKHFSISVNTVSFSISFFALGVAVSQLILGPLSDRFGRKKLLILGLLASITGALGCINASNYSYFIVFRVVQALGCGCFVLSQALVQDMFAGTQRNSVRILLTTASGVFICLSPMFGSALQQWFDWPGSFVAFTALAVLVLLMSQVLLTENIQPSASTFSTYLVLYRDRPFMTYSTIASIAFACHFAFIVVSPLLFMERLGMGTYAFSWVFIGYGLAYLLGGLIASSVHRRISVPAQLAAGVGLIGCGGATLIVWSLLGEVSVASLLIPMMISTVGTTLARPAATSCALERHPERAGTAAALLNTLVFAAGGSISWAIALSSAHLPTSLGIGLLMLALLGVGLMRSLRA